MRIAEQRPQSNTGRYLSICILHHQNNHAAITTETLQDAGFDVRGTGDPSLALRLLQEGFCRTILADVDLLGVDGFEFLETALNIDPGAQIILTIH